jgi:ribose-phosphate pyrophosphokinase
MKIVLGPSAKDLGEKIANIVKVESLPVAFKNFPDGESYIRIEGSMRGEEVIIVQTTSPPQDQRLIQLALMADAAKRSGATNVKAVVPYLAYARQDRVFLAGEALSTEAVANMLKAAGVNSLLTFNVHQEKALSRFPFPAKTLSAIPVLAEYFKRRGLEGAFSLAPDDGALYMAEQAEHLLKGGYGFLQKHRDLYTGKVSRDLQTGQVNIEKKSLEVKGKTVVIFDDIISSGGTIVSAARILKKLEAGRIFASCVHPLLIGDAEKRIVDAGVEEIVGTDSVPSAFSKVSLAPLVAKELLG